MLDRLYLLRWWLIGAVILGFLIPVLMSYVDGKGHIDTALQVQPPVWDNRGFLQQLYEIDARRQQNMGQ